MACSHGVPNIMLKGDIMETVAANVETLISHNRSMAIALDKAENGSQVEDMYFLEKLEKSAILLGYKLVKNTD